MNNLLSESDDPRGNMRTANLNSRNYDAHIESVPRNSNLINQRNHSSRPISLFSHLHSNRDFNRDFTSEDYEVSLSEFNLITLKSFYLLSL